MIIPVMFYHAPLYFKETSMKKYLYPALLLAVAGAFFSGILTHQHFFGKSAVSSFFCGSTAGNPCEALSLTRYSVLFGIPVAVYGLFFYILTAGLLLIADYAKGRYYDACLALVLPVSGLVLLADLVLFIILIIIHIFCPLCITTYVINLLLLLTVFMWYKNIKKERGISFTGFYKDIFNYFKNTADAKAAISLFILFAAFLGFSLVSASGLMSLKTTDARLSYDKIKKFIDEYNAAPNENISVPGSNLIAGNPDGDIKIVVFTDFLCSFCYKFYEVEEYLLSKFRDRLKIEYHSFPLDQDCNNTVQRTVYNNSCIASAAMIASAEQGLFERYSAIHFHNYKKIKAAYNKDIALRLFNSLGTAANTGRFTASMDLKATADMVKNDIALAALYNIKSTPTIFIGNKRITGARPKEVFEEIIRNLMQ